MAHCAGWQTLTCMRSLHEPVSADPLLPLITTVPASGTVEDALAYIARQHDRLRTGAGYSFAIGENHSAQPVGQIGLWLDGIKEGPGEHRLLDLTEVSPPWPRRCRLAAVVGLGTVVGGSRKTGTLRGALERGLLARC